MKAFKILAGAAVAALMLTGGAVASVPDDKNSEILQNIELSDKLVSEISALGECPGEEAVLGVIEQNAEEAELESLAVALELAATSRDWCDSVQAVLAAAVEAAHIALAIRENDATGAGIETVDRNNVLRLGGYGPSWGSGGSAYSY